MDRIKAFAMPSAPVVPAGGAAASLIGVITELKATPGNCAARFNKYCSPAACPSVRA